MIIKGITETEVSVRPVDLAKVFVTQMSCREKVEFFSWIGRLYGKDSYDTNFIKTWNIVVCI